jgi:predicted DNA-binding transcriptional regulator AlpA
LTTATPEPTPAAARRSPSKRRKVVAVEPKMDQLTLDEALTEIRASRAAFYRWRARGVAPKHSKLPSGEIRISRADLDAWWAEQGRRAC